MLRGKIDDELTPEKLSQELDDCRARKELLALSVRALACYLKDFSFDLADIDADVYKAHVDDMVKFLISDDSVRSMERSFERDQKGIAAFITKEKRYLDHRESEFKNLIELLRHALADVMGESREFGNKVYEGNVRMEEIVNLDDIRRVKEALQCRDCPDERCHPGKTIA